MVIEEMSEHECLRILGEARVGRLGCAKDGQPYVVPISYAYHRGAEGAAYLYGFTTVGQKVEWMRANPLVCVEWDEIVGYEEWASVIAFGRYEELGTIPGGESGVPPGRLPARADSAPVDVEPGPETRLAAELLRQDHAAWWQPGWAVHASSIHRDRTEPYRPLYYRIRIDRVSGHRARPEDGDRAEPGRANTGDGWVRRTLRGVGRAIRR